MLSSTVGGGNNLHWWWCRCAQINNDCIVIPKQQYSSLKATGTEPDLNLIENSWSSPRGKLYEKNTTLKTKDDVWKEACEIWYKIMGNSRISFSVHKIMELTKKNGKNTLNYWEHQNWIRTSSANWSIGRPRIKINDLILCFLVFMK